MDDRPLSEDLARLYAEFSGSIRGDDGEAARNIYRQLRSSGQPIAEILNEAIRTIGVSYDELENVLLGPRSDPEHIQPEQPAEPAELEYPKHNRCPEAINSRDLFEDSAAKVSDGPVLSLPLSQSAVDPGVRGPNRIGALFQTAIEVVCCGFYTRLMVWVVVVVSIIVIGAYGGLPFSGGNKVTSQGGTPVPAPGPAAALSRAAAINPATAPIPVLRGTAAGITSAGVPTFGVDTSSDPPITPPKAETGKELVKPAESLVSVSTPTAATPEQSTSTSPNNSPAGRPDAAESLQAARAPEQDSQVQASQPRSGEQGPDAPGSRASPEAGTAAIAPPALRGGQAGADVSILLERGDSLFRIGDITSARWFYERAADNGSGQAALRLGESYDLSFLENAHLRAVRADLSAAVFWYRRARELGVSEAEILLKGIERE